MSEGLEQEMVEGYEVTVRGQFYARDGKMKILKVFGPETFFIPKEVEVEAGRKIENKTVNGQLMRKGVPVFRKCDGLVAAQHIIQRQLLPARLTENYPGSDGFRTCHIVNKKKVSKPADEVRLIDKMPLSKMTLGELQAFCKKRNIQLPVDQFGSPEDACEAVKQELIAMGLKVPVEPAPVESDQGPGEEELSEEEKLAEAAAGGDEIFG